MKVLLLTQVLPHPADSGPKVKTAAVLRYLAERHDVTLVSFTRGDQAEAVEHLRQFCREVRGVPLRRGRIRDAWYMGRSLLGGESFLMTRDARASMHALLRGLHSGGERFDIVHADQLNMAQYAAGAAAARVLDAHNALWMVTERLARTLSPGPRRRLLEREARLLRDYEGRICREFEGILSVSEEDKKALQEAAAEPVEIAVVPIAIDVAAALPPARRPGAGHVLHVGSLLWPPTADGLAWFLREVWPAIRARRPATTLDVAGVDPPAEIREHAGRGGVEVHGYVADLAPLAAAAAVQVVPLRAGGGMRVRILNALAQGIPLVTTRVGCEGIAVENGRHVLIADSEEDFARAVLRLLDAPDLAASLAREGRRLAEERYDYRVVCSAIDVVYRRALGRRSEGAA